MAGRAGRINRYLRTHWDGRQGWFWTAAINLVGLRLLLAPLPGVAPGGGGAALLALFLLASLCLLVWQLVGGWRSAERGLKETGDMFPALAVYAAMLLALAMSLIQATDRVAGFFARPVDMASPGTALLPLSVDGRAILVAGEIGFGLNTALVATVAARPGADTVLLDSAGGNIFAARAMAREIARAGLATRVEGRCFSACTLVFMAGAPRGLGASGRLGFHGYAFDSAMRVQTFDVAREEARDRDWLASRGVGAAFLDRVFSIPPSELWQPGRAELLAAGVIDAGQ